MGKNNSFEKINYSLRPAKSIERKMILQFCLRLTPFSFVENYHYIGFGSIYFSDFILFHKALKINKMSSIEFERNESRARFNLPYGCINLCPGTCNKELSNLLDKNEKNITWLDYDSPLDNSALDDIQTYAGNVSSGSMFLVSFNANSDDHPCVEGDTKIQFAYRQIELKERIAENKIPTISKPVELSKKHLHKLYRKIIINEIEENLNKRNKLKKPDEVIVFKQIINFNYADDAKMMTLGFVFFQKSDEVKFSQCEFHNIREYRNSDEPYEIVAPKLTSDEIKILNKGLPKVDGSEYCIFPMIKNKEFNNASEEYSKVYQYFPQFTEILY